MSKKHNLSASMEDYLEAIFNLSSSGGVVRSKDIAEVLSVSQSSVTGALRSLSDKGLINYKPYGYITLTEKGRKAASGIARKHEIIKSFFVDILGVDPSEAQEAACQAEHAFGSELILRIERLLEFVAGADNGKGIAPQIRAFCDNPEKFAPDDGKINFNLNRTKNQKQPRPLDKVTAGSVVRLATIDAGKQLKQRLAAMGILPNVEISVLRNEMHGEVVVNVKDSKVVLGRGMCNKVMVH